MKIPNWIWVTVGSTAGPPMVEQPSGRRRRAVVAGLVATGLVGSSLLIPGVAAAAVPAFPNNVVVFPDRDFVTVEGYQDRIGQEALVEVTRPGKGVVGSAKAKVAAGDAAFEINHPGGVCWGAGTGLQVTPDISAGDVVSIKFGTENLGETTVQDVKVTGTVHEEGSPTLVVKGALGTGVNLARLEQRVVNPDLDDTDVNRRDIRAVPGGPVAADKGGYISDLATGNGTFTATYDFFTPETAGIAASGGGERIMSWQEEDAGGNRQGLTISEFGELGGPGMGGCPAGPLQSGPVGPTNLAVNRSGATAAVTWTPAVAVPGTPAITGYEVVALGPLVSGERQIIGKRVDGVGANKATIAGLLEGTDYAVEIVSISSAGRTMPAVTVARAEQDSAPPAAPTATPPAGTYATAQSVTLASDADASIYYTTDGTAPFSIEGVGRTATLYEQPIAVPATGTIKVVAVDTFGNATNTVDLAYRIDAAGVPAPGVPTITGVTPGNRTATVNFTAAATGQAATAFVVTATPPIPGAPVTFEVPAPATSATFAANSLQNNTVYAFTVAAKNGGGSSAPSAPTSATISNAVANAGPDQTITRARTATPVTLTAADSGGAQVVYRWEQILTGATDPDKVTLRTPNARIATFDLPVFRLPMTNNPLKFKLTVIRNGNTSTDEVLVTPKPDTVALGSARWKAGDFRVAGTGSVVGATITIHRGSPTGPVVGTGTVVAGPVGTTGGAFELRFRNGAAPATNPTPIFIESNLGGTTTVGFTVPNG